MTQLQQICFVPTKWHFSEIIFERQLFEPFSPGPVHSKQQCQASVCSRAFYHQRRERQGWHNRQAHTPPAAPPPPPRNIKPLSLAHWSHTSGITSKYTLKWMVESHWHLGRTAHLKILKQGTKGLQICLQSSMHSAGLSFLKYLTRQSSQTKQAFYFCCFYGIYP